MITCIYFSDHGGTGIVTLRLECDSVAQLVCAVHERVMETRTQRLSETANAVSMHHLFQSDRWNDKQYGLDLARFVKGVGVFTVLYRASYICNVLHCKKNLKMESLCN
jgi:hypothetical protein